jgi:myo-inositol-1(or 4)-monophosphatase
MNETEIARRFQAAQAIAREAGLLARELYERREELAIESKGLQDHVSRADREVEDLVRARLAQSFPEDGVLGEEAGLSAGADPARGIWAVDPIDGTSSFLTGMPTWCTSIAFTTAERPLLGVVYDPCMDELFTAARGQGARLNGRPIRVSDATALDQGSTAIGFSFKSAPDAILPVLAGLLRAGGIYGRVGSGALMLAHVACGRYLGFYEPHIMPWDCLAGIVLIEEAGGWVNDFLEGDAMRGGNRLVAAAPGVALQLRRLVGA